MNGLIRTRPIGVGTPDCESLSSYIIRLAKANCVGPLILLSSIFDSLRIPHNRGTFGSNEMKSIDGPSGRSQFLAEAVAKATPKGGRPKNQKDTKYCVGCKKNKPKIKFRVGKNAKETRTVETQRLHQLAPAA